MTKAPSTNALGRAVRGFFSEYVPELRGLSRHTLLSYRDTITLLLRYLAASQNSDPATLDLKAISPQAVLAFLNYLEQERHNKTSSRNVRLAAIHAFFRYVAIYTPERIEQAQQILGIPFKRTGTRPIDYLEYEEIRAVLVCVDRTTRQGLRDYALLALLFNTGARVQEVVDLGACDLQLNSPPQVKLFGKGRKTRICPLWPQTAEVLKEYVSERTLDLRSNAPVFCNQRGHRLSRFGIRYILAKYCKKTVGACPSLAGKRLHPHSMRHSCAIHLHKSGVDLASISHWLGHASMNTTNRYATSDLEMKRKAVAQARPPGDSLASPASWHREASVIEWLESL
jgi:site-specific recombinase XerD